MGKNNFTKYLKTLISNKGFKSPYSFFCKLCETEKLKKASFYDILNGKLIPSHARQLQIGKLLNLSTEERAIFYDQFKKTDEDIPADVIDYLKNNKEKIKKIREEIKHENTK